MRSFVFALLVATSMDVAVRRSFDPVDRDLSTTVTDRDARVALIIGVDTYPAMRNENLDGAADDARRLGALLERRFRFESPALLVNEGATRDRIERALDDLAERALSLRSDGRAVTALVFFAGHGTRVRDQAAEESGRDEFEDGLDEAWVPHDGTKAGARVILDDELSRRAAALAARDVQVVLISDSCHAGGLVDARETGRVAEASRRSIGDLRTAARARGGIAAFLACGESELAAEHIDADGRHGGRFSHVLRDVLGRVDARVTFEELGQRIRDGFDREWTDHQQTPRTILGPGTTHRRLFSSARAPTHGAVVRGTQTEEDVVCTLGAFDGVAPGATIAWFEDLAAFEDGRAPIVVGQALAVGAATSRVRVLRWRGRFPATAKALLVRAGAADGPIPTPEPDRYAPRVRVSVEALRETDAGPIADARPVVGGALRLRPGDRYRFRVENLSDEDLYFHLFATGGGVDASAGVPLFPTAARLSPAVLGGQTLLVDGFVASGDDRGRTTVRVLAARRPIDLTDRIGSALAVDSATPRATGVCVLDIAMR